MNDEKADLRNMAEEWTDVVIDARGSIANLSTMIGSIAVDAQKLGEHKESRKLRKYAGELDEMYDELDELVREANEVIEKVLRSDL